MKRVAVILMLTVVLTGVLALSGIANVADAAQVGETPWAGESPNIVYGCYKVPLTISFPALYAASNPVINLPTLRITDNANGTVVYNALIAPGAKSVTVSNVQTGRSYNIRIGFDLPPLQAFSRFYWLNGWDGAAGNKPLEAYLPGINQNTTLSCQSGGAAGVPPTPVTLTVKPPSGVVAGYLGVWAGGTAPTFTPSSTRPEWTGLPTRPAAGVTIELWRAPTGSNQTGALLARAVTNTEGYFLFSKVDPSQTYEVKFTWNNSTLVATPVAATYSGQVYQINAVDGAIFVPGAAFLPAR